MSVQDPVSVPDAERIDGANRAAQAKHYREQGWWRDATLADDIDRYAVEKPDSPAFITETERVTWKQYSELSDRLAGVLVAAGYQPGERVAVQLPDNAAVHIAFVACEKAGLVTVGIGARAGDRELRHLLTRHPGRRPHHHGRAP